MHKGKLKLPEMMKRKNHLLVSGLMVKIILVVCHLEEEVLTGEEGEEG